MAPNQVVPPTEPEPTSPIPPQSPQPTTPEPSVRLAPLTPAVSPLTAPLHPAPAGDTEARPDEAETTALGGPTEAEEEGAFPIEGAQPVLSGFAPLVDGALLAHRYRLIEQTGREEAATCWRATDEVLDRLVVVHALNDEASADSVIRAARRAATATDARFVRVLDAVADADGFYVISEWVEGTPLSEVLRAGPLTAVESAWVVKEVAEPLTTVHPLGLFHSRLDATRVLVTATGGIRIAGLVTDAALAPDPADETKTRTDLEHDDVAALGRLLYACLTSVWPGVEPTGLPEAPMGPAGYASPQRIQPAASAALDRLTDQILAEVPRGGHRRLTTAAQVLTALSQVLGAADSSADLAHRLLVAAVAPARPAAVLNPSAAVLPVIVPAHDDAATTEAIATDPGAADATATPATAHRPNTPADAPRSTVRPDRRAAARRPWSLGFIVLTAIIVLTLITVLIVTLYNQSTNQSEPTPSPSPPATPLAVTGVQSFNPDGGGEENEVLVGAAYDGDLTTNWHTVVYGSAPNFGGIGIEGVGLVVDFGAPIEVREARLNLTNAASPISLLVPVAADAPTAPFDSIAAWQAVATLPDPAPTALGPNGPSPTTVRLDCNVTTRFLLVYFHGTLPPVNDSQFQTGIAEMTFFA